MNNLKITHQSLLDESNSTAIDWKKLGLKPRPWWAKKSKFSQGR